MTIKIVTDSTCDLPREIIEKYDITVIPAYINFTEAIEALFSAHPAISTWEWKYF